jgi:hypothetical protein
MSSVFLALFLFRELTPRASLITSRAFLVAAFIFSLASLSLVILISSVLIDFILNLYSLLR